MNEKWEFRKKEKKRDIELGPATTKGSWMARRESGTSPPSETIRCCKGILDLGKRISLSVGFQNDGIHKTTVFLLLL